MLVDDSLRFFASNLEPRALVLRGNWGVGKTFYWKEQVVKQYFAEANLRRQDRGYAYVSLFGIESLSQIKNGLAYSYVENGQPSVTQIILGSLKHHARRAAKLFTKAVPNETSVGDLGVKINLGTLINDFAFLSIKRALICIDDLERRNSKLSIQDVLGLVSYLVDQRQCRVILILNFDALDQSERKEWERSSEKVFEAELLYQPTPEKSVSVGMRGTEFEWWHEEVSKCLVDLAIDNVRVVARSQRFVRQLLSEMKAESSLDSVADDAWVEIVKVATLLAAANSSRSVGAPSVFDIVNPHRISLANEHDESVLTADEEEWKKKIEQYGMYFGDELDNAIAQSVVDGFPRMDLLVPAVMKWDQIREQHKRDKLFSDAWGLYHSSFEDNQSDLYQAFQNAIPGIVATESAHNVDAAGRILRSMGYEEAATTLFQNWISARSGDRREELLEESFFPGATVVDPEFRTLLDSARAEEAQEQPLTLLDALLQIDSNSWSEAAIASVAGSSPDEVATILLESRRGWRRCVQTLSRYSEDTNEGKLAKANFLRALKIVSESSQLNEDRVRNKLQGANLDDLIADLD